GPSNPSVIPSEVEGSRDVTLKISPRDPSTDAQDDPVRKRSLSETAARPIRPSADSGHKPGQRPAKQRATSMSPVAFRSLALAPPRSPAKRSTLPRSHRAQSWVSKVAFHCPLQRVQLDR